MLTVLQAWCVPAAILLLLPAFQHSYADSGRDGPSGVVETAAQYRREGNIRLAIELLEDARGRLGDACPARVIGELGATYYQANQLNKADELLQKAYEKASTPAERALIANDLGNLNVRQGQDDKAIRYYEEAKSGGNPSTAVSAGLNLARLVTPPGQRLKELGSLSEAIDRVADKRGQARYLVNLGSQAAALGAIGTKLAYESLSRARALATEVGDRWLLAEALDALSQLYEDQNRPTDALQLTEEAIAQLKSEQAQDLLISLEWRRGRLLRGEGRDDLALQAYQSAVNQIEAVRQDIPVKYVNGESSFRQTLEPIYLGLADLLLQQAAKTSGDQREQLYRDARNTVELIKQTELQDYLGNRCSVESALPLYGSSLPPRTAVLYPVILENRLELLLATRDGIEARCVKIEAAALRDKAAAFVKRITARKPSEGEEAYLTQAQEMYDILLRPVESLLERQQIDTLVVVPDGVLRLVPMAALHDGHGFAITKFAIAVAPGLTIAGVERSGSRVGKVLLAGLSDPSHELSWLPQWVVDLYAPGEPEGEARSAELERELALPGVAMEMEELRRKTQGDQLLNKAFTVERFRQQVGAGGYRIVHIASHAMFGSSAETSFVMAYDGRLSLDKLQGLLRTDEVQAVPIELLSLSACQTAKGDDRAPLGFAGAAIRARAATALGSLWPVDDLSAARLMPRFYDLLITEKLTKAKALQRAQLELIGERSFAHPYYWAPFILVGSWQ